MKKGYKFLLSLLGVSSASCIPRVMYGCPYVDFKVEGVVVNEKDEPIPGIQIKNRWDEELGATDENGSFNLQGEATSIRQLETLYFIDTDGDANGRYQKDSLCDIKFDLTRNGSGAWDNGSYEAKNLKVVMKEEK